MVVSSVCTSPWDFFSLLDFLFKSRTFNGNNTTVSSSSVFPCMAHNNVRSIIETLFKKFNTYLNAVSNLTTQYVKTQ